MSSCSWHSIMMPRLMIGSELQTMNKKELVDAMAAKTGSSGAAADRAVNALVEIISDTLKKGDSLTLPGFGTFEVRDRAARTGRNPKTGEELKIAASKVAAFKPGAALKAAVN
jgi:DNA-binding protein HU-beta